MTTALFTQDLYCFWALPYAKLLSFSSSLLDVSIVFPPADFALGGRGFYLELGRDYLHLRARRSSWNSSRSMCWRRPDYLVRICGKCDRCCPSLLLDIQPILDLSIPPHHLCVWYY